MPLVYLGLGANLQDRLAYLNKAVHMLNQHPQIKLVNLSSVYETDPVGGPLQGRYLNAVAAIETDLSPTELLKITKETERQLGRRRDVHWGPRFIDLDLLIYEDVIIKTDLLTLPHPLIAERWFVLVPLNEIAPDLVPPGFARKVSSLLKELGPPQGIELLATKNPWADCLDP